MTSFQPCLNVYKLFNLSIVWFYFILATGSFSQDIGWKLSRVHRTIHIS